MSTNHPLALIGLSLALVACRPSRTRPASASRTETTREERPAPGKAPAESGPTEPLEAVERDLGEGEGPRPTLIALHGLGDRPERFAPMFEGLGLRAHLIALQAPDHDANGGYSWFPLRARGNEGSRWFEEGVRRAVARIVPQLRAAASREGGCGLPVVTGFSQGGMLSFAIAAEHPDLVSTAVPIAGLLPSGMVPRADAEHRPPVIAFHGDVDRLVALREAQRATDTLQRAGYDATLHTYRDVDHEVTAEMRTDIATALRDALSRACPTAEARPGGELGATAAPSTGRPTLVALHGLGDTPDNFAPLFAGDLHANLVVPHGVARYGSGFAWFAPSAQPGDAPGWLERGVRGALDAVLAEIERASHVDGACGLPVVAGFSQGGMLAYALAAAHPDRVAAVVPIAGRLPEGFAPDEDAPRRPEVIAFHGGADEVIDAGESRRAVDRFRIAGYHATLHAYPGVRHTVSDEMRGDITGALREVLSRACPL